MLDPTYQQPRLSIPGGKLKEREPMVSYLSCLSENVVRDAHQHYPQSSDLKPRREISTPSYLIREFPEILKWAPNTIFSHSPGQSLLYRESSYHVES